MALSASGKNNNNGATRRRFVRTAATASAAIATSAFPILGANDRITYGVIGTGGRGRGVNRTFIQLKAQCVALCDVYEPYLDLARKDSPNDARTYVDYHELLQQPGLDAVLIASPDHQHCPMLLAALDARKDVYLEKPLSFSLAQSRQMIDAVRASKQVVQIGMQRRSAPALHEAKKLVDDGVLGRVTAVKPQWNWNIAQPLDNSPLPGTLDWQRFLGSAPARPLEPMRFRRWRYFFDYAGGNMTDQGTHLMDVVQWFLRSGAPQSAVSQGFVAKMKGAEHPDVFSAVFEYPNFVATWSLNYDNSYQNGWAIQFQGDLGTMILNDAGYTVYAEPWKEGATPIYQKAAPVPLEPHVQNFLDSVRARKEPNCPVEVAAAAVAGPHMANIAWREGRKVKQAG